MLKRYRVDQGPVAHNNYNNNRIFTPDKGSVRGTVIKGVLLTQIKGNVHISWKTVETTIEITNNNFGIQ